jgi:cell division protein FtsB
VIYHLLHGNRGLLALFEIQKIVSVERGKLNDLESEVALLAHRVALLRPQSLDKDMLDERVRDVLNLAQSTEIIIDTNEILLEEDKDSG